MEGCQHSFHGLEKIIILTTIPVYKTGLNVDEDHEDSAMMTESLFFFNENNDGDDGNTEKPLACRTGVIFCAFNAKIGESEASAKRESRASERAGKK